MATQENSVELVDANVATSFARAALFAALMGSFAYFAIPLPFSPTSITLQTLGAFLAGLYLGPYWGGASMGLYIAAGGLGVPVFAQGSGGFGYLVAEPSTGFIWSFLVAAMLVGAVVHRGGSLRNPATVPTPVLVAVLVSANLIIYAMGAGFFMWLTGTGLSEALSIMVAPFIAGDSLKILAAIAIVKSDVIDPTQS